MRAAHSASLDPVSSQSRDIMYWPMISARGVGTAGSSSCIAHSTAATYTCRIRVENSGRLDVFKEQRNPRT